MKSKIPIILCTFFITITSFSQQISDGLATQISDFTVPLGSGAYNGYNPTGSIPDLSFQGGWQHLLVVRHPNGNNNFQLQIASSMTENDKLYFRKLVPWSTTTNSNWTELATRGANTFMGNQYVVGNIQILEGSDSRPGGQSAPTKSILKLSRNGTGNYSWNEHAEFRIGHGGNSVYGSKLDLYVNGGANTTSVPDQHVMTWNYDGNVGIGTTNPTSKLTVAGNINSREVKVTVDAGADFVFENNYNLPSLHVVDRFIKENKHLPEIASADEMKKDGINLSEMNIKLLQKIEELTLYIIQQEKKNSSQNLEIEDSKNEIEILKKQNESFKSILERLAQIEEKIK